MCYVYTRYIFVLFSFDSAVLLRLTLITDSVRSHIVVLASVYRIQFACLVRQYSTGWRSAHTLTTTAHTKKKTSNSSNSNRSIRFHCSVIDTRCMWIVLYRNILIYCCVVLQFRFVPSIAMHWTDVHNPTVYTLSTQTLFSCDYLFRLLLLLLMLNICGCLIRNAVCSNLITHSLFSFILKHFLCRFRSSRFFSRNTYS